MKKDGLRRIGWGLAVAAVAGLLVAPSLAAGSASADSVLPTLTLTRGAGVNTATFSVGETVTISSATWSPTPDSVEYQWYRDHEPIATGSSYTFTPDDQGQQFTFTETATAAGYQPYVFQWSSNIGVTGPASLGSIQVETPPAIAGTPRIGQPVQISSGIFDPGDVDVWYEFEDQDGTHWVDASDPAGYTPSANSDYWTLEFRWFAYEAGYVAYSGPWTHSAPTLPVSFLCDSSYLWGYFTVGTSAGVQVNCSATPDSYQYQWSMDGTQIAGANQSTILLTSDMVGHHLSVLVTATRADIAPYSATVTVTDSRVVLEPFPSVPTPTISGDPVVGSTLTADPGDWGVPGATFTYAWMVGSTCVVCRDTSGTLTLGAAEAGRAVSVEVTAIATGYESITSPASAPSSVIPPIPVPISSAKLTGSAHVNLAISPSIVFGSGAPANPDLSYVWKLNGAPIPGATGTSYTPQSSDLGKSLSVSVSAASPVYSSNTVTSNSLVIGEPFVNGGATIVGTPRVGSTLSVDLYAWPAGPIKYTYIWMVMDGADFNPMVSTRPTLVVPPALLGHELTVMVQGSEPGYITEPDSWSGGELVTIGRGLLTVQSAPTISGTPMVGDRLTASRGSWSPSSGVTYHYQWYSAVSASATPTPIAHATSFSYVVSSAEVRMLISVRITAAKLAYTSVSDFSVATQRVAPIPIARPSRPRV